jgi:formylmethanofuran dehydrogenase subunit B
MRKLHGKGNEFETEENLSKAAEILIESKNKHIKEIMQSFQE